MTKTAISVAALFNGSIAVAGRTALVIGMILATFTFSTYDALARDQKISYAGNLLSVLEDLNQNKSVSTDRLINCIPATEDQWIIFYSFSDVEANDKRYTMSDWGKLQQLFFEQAVLSDDVYRSLIKFLNYIDGDYAEVYKESFDGIVAKNPARFCKLLNDVEILYPKVRDYVNTYCDQ